MNETGTKKLLLNVKEVAKIVGICRSAIYLRVNEGAFPAPVHVGRRVLWRVADVEAWVEKGCPSK